MRSTLEQQLVKNLTGDNEQDDCVRCARSSARWVCTTSYSKETILEAYLNTIPLTGIIHGMEAGSIEYFGKHVEELTWPSAPTLASITKNPTKYNPAYEPRRSHQAPQPRAV